MVNALKTLDYKLGFMLTTWYVITLALHYLGQCTNSFMLTTWYVITLTLTYTLNHNIRCIF